VEAKQFVQLVEDYYGTYRPAVKAAVFVYVKNMSSRLLTMLWEEVTNLHSTVYKTPPDKAILQKARRNVLNERYMELEADYSRRQVTDGIERREEVAELLQKLVNELRYKP
jgi:hypothetical protein